MGKPDFLVVGHLTKDIVNEGFRLGGTATYSALTARRLGLRVALVTSASPAISWQSTFRGIEVHCIPSPVTTTFRNVYWSDKREQKLLSVANRITTRDVPPDWTGAPIVHLGPVAQELEPALAFAFPEALVGVTPQGWMRGWDERGRVYFTPWKDAPHLLPYIGVLILSEEDIAHQEELIADYAGMVPVLVLTEGRRGARVHFKGEWYHVPAFPATERDPTGAGDVFAAAYLVYYAQMREPLAAATFANCVASFAVEGEGITHLPTLEEVEKRMARLATAVRLPTTPFT